MAKNQRTRPRTKSNAPVGLGRVSKSLGPGDPRYGRNAQMAQAPQIHQNDTLTRDRLGRQGVKPIGRVKQIDVAVPVSTTSVEDMAGRLAAAEEKINELLRMLTNGGLMEGGR